MTLVERVVTIAAPAPVVWRHLTTAAGLRRWVGPDAVADAVPGGALRWTHPDGSTVAGRFVELVPYRRVVFTYGWQDGRFGVPPGATTVEIDLTEHDGATTLRLVHRGLADGIARPHDAGWAHFLGVLADRLAPGAS